MSRIETRESLVAFIYQTEFRTEDIEEQIKLYIDNNPEIEEDREYFFTLALGIIDNRDSIDAEISKFLKKWTIDRIPKLDRAILETAVYEIKNCEDIPTSVSINEAVKLAKKYGTDNSQSYINGVLSSFEKSL